MSTNFYPSENCVFGKVLESAVRIKKGCLTRVRHPHFSCARSGSASGPDQPIVRSIVRQEGTTDPNARPICGTVRTRNDPGRENPGSVLVRASALSGAGSIHVFSFPTSPQRCRPFAALSVRRTAFARKKRAGIGFGPDSHPPFLFSIPARGSRAGRSFRGEGPPSVRAGSADCGLASHRRKAPNRIRSSREEHFGRPTPRTWRRRPSFRRPHSDSPRGREDLQKRTGKRRRTGIAPPCTSREAAEAVCPAGRNGRNANPFTQQIPVRPHRPMCSPRAFGGDRNTFFSSSACIFIGRNHRKGKLFVKTKGKPESV